MTFLVTINVEPTPRTFLVENVADPLAALARVRGILGSDPGVAVEVVATPITKNVVQHFPNLSGV